MDVGVSQRHLSFVECGRSRPGRGLITAWMDALDVPFRDRNSLLHAAGFASRYAEAPWDAGDMSVVTKAIRRMLRQHDPYPALVLDRHWNVVMVNASAPRFFGHFVDLDAFPEPRNLLRLVFDSNALRPWIENWPVVASNMLRRVRREAVAGVLDGEAQRLVSELEGLASSAGDDDDRQGRTDLPVIPIAFAKGGFRSSWFSLVSVVGTPQSVEAQELRVECMFPADAASEAAYARWVATDG